MFLFGAGFGETGSGSSDHLLDVPVPYVTNAACNSQYSGGISSAMMCAGDLYGDGGEGKFLNNTSN